MRERRKGRDLGQGHHDRALYGRCLVRKGQVPRGCGKDGCRTERAEEDIARLSFIRVWPNRAVNWGLRSPNSDANNAYNINTDGTVFNYNVYRAYFAPRPAFNLKSEIVVSDSTDADGCYTIESLPGAAGGLYVKNNGVWVQAA